MTRYTFKQSRGMLFFRKESARGKHIHHRVLGGTLKLMKSD